MSRMFRIAFVGLLVMAGCTAVGGGGGPNDEVTAAIRTACTGQFQNDGALAAYVARVVVQRNTGVSYETQLLADQNACAGNPSPNCLGCVTEVNSSVFGR